MKKSFVKFLGLLFLAGAVSVPTGGANALFIGFGPPLTFGTPGGTIDTLAIDFDTAAHIHAAYPLLTANNVWITTGGAINIAAGVNLSATLTIATGADATFLPLTAVFEDATGSLSEEIVLAPALSTVFSSQTYNLTLPFSPQASAYDLYFGLKQTFPGDSVDISSITLNLEQTAAPSGQISAPATAAIFGLAFIGFAAVRRKRR